EWDTLEGVKAAAAGCTRCPLHCDATSTVFGDGPQDARLMIVGEQPGDREDLSGRPFVGPAGQLLDRALVEAGVDRAATYMTNAVKHFKFTVRGKRRIHQSPDVSEIETCRFWLDRERSFVKPRVILGLGLSAARALTGRSGTMRDLRQQLVVEGDGTVVRFTVHPAALLRLPDLERERAWPHFVEDIRAASLI
ncbi:MAG: UdgX family uracil-DNA binding protein, partial [Pacificimonas sp.]